MRTQALTEARLVTVQPLHCRRACAVWIGPTEHIFNFSACTAGQAAAGRGICRQQRAAGGPRGGRLSVHPAGGAHHLAAPDLRSALAPCQGLLPLLAFLWHSQPSRSTPLLPITLLLQLVLPACVFFPCLRLQPPTEHIFAANARLACMHRPDCQGRQPSLKVGRRAGLHPRRLLPVCSVCTLRLYPEPLPWGAGRRLEIFPSGQLVSTNQSRQLSVPAPSRRALSAHESVAAQ